MKQVKGTRILMGNEAKEYQAKIDMFRSCLHR